MIRQRWPWLAGGLLLYTIAFHFESLLFGRIYFSLDTFAYFYPMETYYATSLRAGQLPLWNPHIFGGVPFLANSQAGVYYPLNLAFLFGSIPSVYSLELAAHSLIAAGGMLWFGRRFVGLSWIGAIVAGMAFGFGGAIVTMAGHLNQVQVAAWLPWMLGAGHQLVVRPGARPLVLLAILIACKRLPATPNSSISDFGRWRSTRFGLTCGRSTSDRSGLLTVAPGIGSRSWPAQAPWRQAYRPPKWSRRSSWPIYRFGPAD